MHPVSKVGSVWIFERYMRRGRKGVKNRPLILVWHCHEEIWIIVFKNIKEVDISDGKE